MADVENELYQQLVEMMNENQSGDEIKARIRLSGYDDAQVDGIYLAAKQLRDQKRRTTGLAYILTGAVVCLASCVITLLNGSEGFSSITLIGLTTVGVAIVFAGLMKVF